MKGSMSNTHIDFQGEIWGGKKEPIELLYTGKYGY